ncbi:protein MAINTENANCE OF MERISTEMS-like [Medicago truncatula]|uniref:protein MAINTENANCE OF MERISTEMS-like n=1 Tax=Medicago truncatula TaxID=3880 RepID=UPI0019679358|nr:protein MAINTENANCE OF MERISTEMS-like [Medicago truncatula]
MTPNKFEETPRTVSHFKGGSINYVWDHRNIMWNTNGSQTMNLHVRNTRVLKPINHGAKILTLGRPNGNENWFWDALQQSGLHDLVYLGYSTVPHALLLTLCERWHPETSTFHMPMGEMTVTLDDVACLMHLPIEGRMLAHGKKMPKHEGAALLMTYLGVAQHEAEKICNQEYGGYISYPRLRDFYTSYLGRANVLAGTEDPEEVEELERVRTYCVRCYLLYLVGCLLFGDRSNKRIELIYLTTMADGYAGMRNYSWGAMTLAYLYGELADACRPGHRALGGSVTLLTAWFLAHFPGFFSVDLNTDYLENYPVAARWKLQKGHGEGITYRSLLDRIQLDDVCWRPYEEHREIQDFEEVFWYSGWIMCGVRRAYRHLPERVLRQYGYVQTIPRHPTDFRDLPPPSIVQMLL